MVLTTEIRNKAKYLISLYPNLPYLIYARRMELLSSNNDHPDENIGGSSGVRVGQPTEQKAILLTTDPHLRELERTGEVLEDLEGDYPSERIRLIESLYMRQESRGKVAKDLGISVRTLERWNKEFLTDFAERMGLFEERGEWE